MEPTTIVDQPIPFLGAGFGDPAGQNSSDSTSGAETQRNIVDTPIIAPVIAIDTIGNTLDTQSRKIKGSFTFEQLGAFQIGTFVAGVSGDIVVSPDGIVAQDKNGATTFSLDGTTGNGTFKGTLIAGTLIGGDSNVLIGNGTSGGGRIILYVSGVPAIIIGDPS